MRNLIREPSRRARAARAPDAPRFPWFTVLALSAGLAGLTTLALKGRTVERAEAATSAAALGAQPTLASLGSFAPLFDPAYDLGGGRQTFASARPLAARIHAPSPVTTVSAPAPALPTGPLVLASLPGRDAGLAGPATPSTALAPIALAPLPLARPGAPGVAAAEDEDGPDTTMVAPMPMRRPSDAPSTATAPEAPRIATRRNGRNQTAAAADQAPAQPDGRTFFERLFGPRRDGAGSGGPELAYAPSDGNLGTDASSSRGGGFGGFSLGLSGPAPRPPMGVAIYDIGSRLVYLPNGEKLEAHSGLGAYRNDVRYAHLRMRGVTPPHVYDLTEREALFHGVRAIRLNPVGGSQAIHGRAGLLAHTFLLGPNGDSNGCISIRHYDRFLQAYLRGEIRRLIVVRDRNEAVAAVARAGTRVSSR
jgi:hypothetical protein